MQEPNINQWNICKSDRHMLEIIKKRADQLENRNDLQEQIKIN